MDSYQPAIKPKVGKNIAGCVFIVLALLLFIVGLLTLALAKSGVLHIPVFSNLYHGPKPTRVVDAPPLSAGQFESLVQARLLPQLNTSRPPFHVTLSERELTGALDAVFAEGLRSQGWKQDRAQIVVVPQNIEIFTELERGPYHADLLIKFVPHVSAAGVGFDPVSIQVGDYTFPPALAYPMISWIFSRDLGTFSLDFGAYHLDQMTLKDGAVDISIAPKPQ